MEIAYYDKIDFREAEEELSRLRKEIGFLSSTRRKIIYSWSADTRFDNRTGAWMNVNSLQEKKR